MSIAGAARPARVFFALWPDDKPRQTLAKAALESQAECGGRAVPAEKIHLTLFFVGEVERARVLRLQELAGLLRGDAFELEMCDLGYWRHNRIIWAGARSCPPSLASFVSALTQALLKEDVQGEDRPYVPHVTLVRNARRAPKHTRVTPVTWAVREFMLVESVNGSSGSRYEIVARWPLGRQANACPTDV